MKKLSEFDLIEKIKTKPRRDDVIVGIGDDSAVIKMNGTEIISTDCHVDEIHFRKDWFTASEIGRKAIIANISLIALRCSCLIRY